MAAFSRKIAGLVAVLILGLSFGSMNEVSAYREPEFTTNLGGLPISCSVYAEQVGIGSIHTGEIVRKRFEHNMGVPKISLMKVESSTTMMA